MGHRVTSGLSVATPKSRAISSASTRQTGVDDKIVNGVDGAMSGDESINRSMPTGMPGTGGTRTPGSATGSLGDSTVEGMAVPVAGNIYPLHLLYTTNYRLPDDAWGVLYVATLEKMRNQAASQPLLNIVAHQNNNKEINRVQMHKSIHPFTQVPFSNTGPCINFILFHQKTLIFCSVYQVNCVLCKIIISKETFYCLFTVML